MKILICGATGFMGRNLFEHFLKYTEHQVYGTALNGILYHENIRNCNLKDERAIQLLFDEIQPDIVIQAAASTTGVKDTIEHPHIHIADNVVINSLLLRAAFDYKIKHFLFLSCGVMYQPSKIPLKESDWNANDEISSVYFGGAWTKIYIEKMCKFYSNLGMKCTSIRHSNTYGPHDKYDPEHSHVLGGTIHKVMNATDTISVWGTGEESRDLIYVNDVINAIQILMDKQTSPFELVNVSAGHAISINDLVNKIIYHSGKQLKITHDITKPTVPLSLVFDHSYIKNKYGWAPTVDIDTGLKLTIDWYKKNYMEKK
jgi:nucleoside-diphosphate-sugar epimerase